MTQENDGHLSPFPGSIPNESYFESDELINQLSNQLEYYFSPQNLASDNYMKSVMQMNSGFIPISILANFSNVKKIIARFHEGTDFSSLDVNKLLQTSALASSNLKIVELDSHGTILSDRNNPHSKLNKNSVVWGIGSTFSGNDGSTPATAVNKSHTNLVILRDVPEEATEEDIKNIFADENGHGPTIDNIQKEIGHCWFVHISPDTSKPNLIALLLNLRSKTICGVPAQARLKTHSSIARSTNPYRSFKLSRYNDNQIGTHPNTEKKSAHVQVNNEKVFSKQKKKCVLVHGVVKEKKVVEKVAPPDLGEAQFPGLCSFKINETKPHAQTTSGYASALLKNPPKNENAPTKQSQNYRTNDFASKNKNDDSKSTTSVSSTDDSSASSKSGEVSRSGNDVTTSPPTMAWGGRSFADILKA